MPKVCVKRDSGGPGMGARGWKDVPGRGRMRAGGIVVEVWFVVFWVEVELKWIYCVLIGKMGTWMC